MAKPGAEGAFCSVAQDTMSTSAAAMSALAMRRTSCSSLAHAEELHEIADIVLARHDRNLIDPHGPQRRRQVVRPLTGQRFVAPPDGRATTIHDDALAAFGIFEFDQPSGGQLGLAGIRERNGDQIVAARGYAQTLFIARRLEVRHKEDNRAAVCHTAEKIEGLGNIGTRTARFGN